MQLSNGEYRNRTPIPRVKTKRSAKPKIWKIYLSACSKIGMFLVAAREFAGWFSVAFEERHRAEALDR